MRHKFDSAQMLVLALKKKTSFESSIKHKDCWRLSVIDDESNPVLPADLDQMSPCCFNEA